jgi:hypothetical protein
MLFFAIYLISSATYAKNKLTTEWRIDDRKAPTADQIIHISDAQHLLQLLGWHLHRPG